MPALDSATIRAELQQLYGQSSKHSAYQSIPAFVSEALEYSEPIARNWRDDRNRLHYLMSQRRPSAGECWGDFGANTGFFTLSLAHEFPASSLVAIEANPTHASFVRKVADLFELENVSVTQASVGLREVTSLPKFDVLLHLNVLHHAGGDFDAGDVTDAPSFLAYARRYLSALRSSATTLVFQMGSNLWGDKRRPIIAVDDDLRKIRLLASLLRDAGWSIRSVAYPVIKSIDHIEYVNLSDAAVDEVRRGGSDSVLDREIKTLELDRHIGEFYRRPLFIMDSGG